MWASVAKILLPAAATLGGAYISSQANQEAARVANEGAVRAAQIEAQAIDRQIAAIEEGNRQAQETLGQLRVEAQPGTTYLRNVVAGPGTLTPAQSSQLEDLRRELAGAIRTSNFAGSGRTAAELFRSVEADFVNDALEHNRDRAFGAATSLHNVSANAAGNIAQSQAGTGERVGGALATQGRVAGAAERGVADTTANATTANARIAGQALGDIGSLIATEGRESRYR